MRAAEDLEEFGDFPLEQANVACVVDAWSRMSTRAVSGRPGVMRRFPRGRDELFGRNLAWGARNVSGQELTEVSGDEAQRIVRRPKMSAAELAVPAAAPGGKPEPADLGIDVKRLDSQRSGDSPGGIEIAVPDVDGWVRGDWVLMRIADDDSDRVLVFDRNEWTCFLDGARKGEFDDAVS